MKASKKNSRGPPMGTPEMKKERSFTGLKTEFKTIYFKVRNHEKRKSNLELF